MKFNYCALALAAAVAACGCGGGGGGGGGGAIPIAAMPAAPPPDTSQPSEQPPEPVCTVALWGDSILHGGYNVTERLEEPPAAALKRLRPRWSITDNSLNGASAYLNGAQFIQSQLPERVQVIEYGMNDATLGAPYEPNLRAMIERAKSLGRLPIVTGLSHLATDTAARDAYNDKAKALAGEYGIAFADWDTVAFDPGDTMDGTHPNQAYSVRLVARLAETLDALAPECSGD